MRSPLLSTGHGPGLRAGHYGRLLEAGVPFRWTEAITENFVGRGGRPRAVLERVRRDAEVILHGVSMSLGGTDPLDRCYLMQLRELRRSIEAAWISDHLCFNEVHGHHGHDLWPVPFTEESLDNVARRVEQVQDTLGEPILVENVSSYLQWKASSLTEWEFLTELSERTGCQLLLDLNNVYVSSRNHGFDPRTFLDALPPEAVGQYHLAGHEDRGAWVLDSHDGPVADEVLALYVLALRRFGPRVAIVEWDGAVPALERVMVEVERAGELTARALEERWTADGAEHGP